MELPQKESTIPAQSHVMSTIISCLQLAGLFNNMLIIWELREKAVLGSHMYVSLTKVVSL